MGKNTDTHSLKRRYQSLRQRGHKQVSPRTHTELFKHCFVNRCSFNFIS